MKVHAFVCDVCNEFTLEKYTVGIEPKEDLFEKYKSYPSIPNANKADIHYCMRCFRKYVYNCITADRVKDADEYTYQFTLFAFKLRETAVMNSNRRRLNNSLRKRS